MARTAGRSRGCRTCRQRRIKCDETLPECTRCKKSQRRCPGPITDTFYVVVTSSSHTWPSNELAHSVETDEDRLSRYHTGKDRMYNTSEFKRIADATSTPDVDKSSSKTSPSTNIPDREAIPNLPTYYQPSRVEAFDQLFFSHFFDACGSGIETVGACSWLSKLPARMATVFQSLAMKYSARATTMAFYGILNGEVSIQNEARNIYGKALAAQQNDMIANREQNYAGRRTASGEVICSIIMMGYFEITVKTTPLAWIHHFDAAAAMLESKGPETCQTGFEHQLFRSTRLGMAFSSVVLRTTHVFAQTHWTTIPFTKPKPQLDHLVDVVLAIPEYILLADRINHGTSDFVLQLELISGFEAGLSNLLSNLDIQTRHSSENNSMTEISFRRDQDQNTMAFSDPFDGCLAAISHAAYLICFSLLASVDISESSNVVQAINHSAAVLRAIEYVDTCSHAPASSLYMTTVFSLNVVAMWSPSSLHKDYAFRKLGNTTPFEGPHLFDHEPELAT